MGATQNEPKALGLQVLLARQVGVPCIIVSLNKCDMVDDVLAARTMPPCSLTRSAPSQRHPRIDGRGIEQLVRTAHAV